MYIQTVQGPVAPERVTHTQCHEHLLIAKGKSFEINPVLCIDDVKKSEQELTRYGQKGGCLVVDAQPGGCGRMSKGLAEISWHSGVHIVASTGFHKLMFYPEDHWIHSITTEAFAKLMIDELTQGMYLDGDDHYPEESSPHKAGMIKMALDKEGLSERYLKILDAGIIASRTTGAPIQCHTESADQGEVVATYLLKSGVSAENIIIAHLDRDESKTEEILATAKLGVFLQFDTIGRFKYHDDPSEVELIRMLIEAGYEDQLLIGLDTTRARLLSYGGEVGLDYILESFVPLLKASDIPEAIIMKITVTNPRRALAQG